MWKGGGGGIPPSLLKIISQKRCKYQCFCFLRLVAMEGVIFEFVGFMHVFYACVTVLRCFMHVFSQNTVNTGVLFKGVAQKHCKIQLFGHVVL